MAVKKQTLNITLSAAALAVSVLQVLVMAMGATAAIVAAAFISGLAIGVLISRYVTRTRKI